MLTLAACKPICMYVYLNCCVATCPVGLFQLRCFLIACSFINFLNWNGCLRQNKSKKRRIRALLQLQQRERSTSLLRAVWCVRHHINDFLFSLKIVLKTKRRWYKYLSDENHCDSSIARDYENTDVHVEDYKTSKFILSLKWSNQFSLRAREHERLRSKLQRRRKPN